MPAICLALGSLFAVLSVLSDIRYARAMHTMGQNGMEALWLFEQADGLFPLQMRNRQANAIFKAAHEGIAPPVALTALARVLPADPDGPALLFYAGVQELRLGNTEAAHRHLSRLEIVAPHWGQTPVLRDSIHQVEAIKSAPPATVGR